MSLSKLHISDLRNISNCAFEFSPQFNVITGANGSGKTSILEAIYLMGRGKSFRSTYSRKLVKNGQSSLTVFGMTSDPVLGEKRIGIQISEGKLTSKVNGEFLTKSSKLASLLPLLLINPDADKLIKGSPRLRRSFLDWGLFHVEQSFLSIWQRYSRVLLQRNAQLRTGKDGNSYWDQQLIEAAEALHAKRVSYAKDLAEVAKFHFQKLVGIESVSFRYSSGWPKGMLFADALAEKVESDAKAGFTQRGPHRADLVMFTEEKKACDYLSGGQQKLAACALILAQAKIFIDKVEKPCLLLVDDLPAELDTKHRKTLIDLLADTGCQLFITTTDAELLELSSYENVSMFHVEHGAVSVY